MGQRGWIDAECKLRGNKIRPCRPSLAELVPFVWPSMAVLLPSLACARRALFHEESTSSTPSTVQMHEMVRMSMKQPMACLKSRAINSTSREYGLIGRTAFASSECNILSKRHDKGYFLCSAALTKAGLAPLPRMTTSTTFILVYSTLGTQLACVTSSCW